MELVKVFDFEGSKMSFEQKDGKVMVNATEMGKAFGKQPVDFLKTQRVKDFIDELSGMKKIIPTDLVVVINGGDEYGTWMHEDVALEFARWLSPSFSIWCNDRIKELLTTGQTSLAPQTYKEALFALIAAEEEKERLCLQVDNLSTALDCLLEWVSIIKVAQHNKVSEKVFAWQKLKQTSLEMGFQIKKAQSPRFAFQNLYHINVFKRCYPQYDYNIKK